jgi:putative tricarboxylic transport membrane protein
MFELILTGFHNVFTPSNLGISLGGLLVGMVFGALPGFSAVMAVSVMIPFSYYLRPEGALLMLSGVYCGAIYGGSISAVLIGIPGTPASAPTAMEGIKFTRRGEGARGLAMATWASAFGGMASSVALLLGAPLLAIVALKVGPPEQMMIAIFGLTIVCTLSNGNVVKGLMVGFFFLTMSCVGLDPRFASARFTFGLYQLTSGLPLVPILIGLFSFPEVFGMLKEGLDSQFQGGKVDRVWPRFDDIRSTLWTSIKSALLGIGIGIVPAAGPDIASFVAYNSAKSKEVHECEDEPNLNGLVAAETANNGVTGGSLIPLLTLGIPGSSVAALYLGAMYIHGLIPGPTLFTNHGPEVYTLLVGFLVINFALLFVGMFVCNFSSKILQIRRGVLATLITVLAVMGAYAVRSNLMDIAIMFAAGILGYIMKSNNFPLSPVALSMLLGAMLEKTIYQSLSMTGYSILLIFQRPLTVVFALFVVVSLAYPQIAKLISERKTRK